MDAVSSFFVVTSAAARRQIKKDQLNVIFDVIGTPSKTDLDRVRTPEAREYLASLDPRDPIDLADKYPTASPEAIDLVTRMLLFFPEDRISADAALTHPFFAKIRDAGSEARYRLASADVFMTGSFC